MKMIELFIIFNEEIKLFNPTVQEFKYGRHTVKLETGVIARQATAAVMVNMDDTAVFVSVVAKPKAKEGQDFFPLTVNYQERTYAAGRIPGGFFRPAFATNSLILSITTC